MYESSKCDLFQDWALWGSLKFYSNFQLFHFCIKSHWDFDRDCTEPVHYLEQSEDNATLILSLPIHEEEYLSI